MDLLMKMYAHIVQMMLKLLLVLLTAALYLAGRLILPVIRTAVVALVRFPAVVAERHYDSQQAEIDWLLLAEARRAATASTKPPVPPAALVSIATTLPASESDATATPEPDGLTDATAEPLPVPTSVVIEAPESEAEPPPGPTPEPDPEDSAEADEGPVLRYRPKPASGD